MCVETQSSLNLEGECSALCWGAWGAPGEGGRSSVVGWRDEEGGELRSQLGPGSE